MGGAVVRIHPAALNPDTHHEKRKGRILTSNWSQFMRKFQEYRTTTSRKVYNRISLFYEDVWSSRERNWQRRTWYGGDTAGSIRHPSWKMTSKARKQWAKKRVPTREYTRPWSGSIWVEYSKWYW
jgi:DNA-directed RNA polymerase delta subunit